MLTVWSVGVAPSAVHTRNPSRWERTDSHLPTKDILKFFSCLAFNRERWKIKYGGGRFLLH